MQGIDNNLQNQSTETYRLEKQFHNDWEIQMNVFCGNSYRAIKNWLKFAIWILELLKSNDTNDSKPMSLLSVFETYSLIPSICRSQCANQKLLYANFYWMTTFDSWCSIHIYLNCAVVIHIYCLLFKAINDFDVKLNDEWCKFQGIWSYFR